MRSENDRIKLIPFLLREQLELVIPVRLVRANKVRQNETQKGH